jgi:hypothetical protein
MDDYIDIQPTDVVRSCVKIKMNIINFQLNAKNCVVNVQKYDAANILIDIVNVFINDEEYSQWSYDDSYIIDLVLDKLGMTPADVVVEN